MDRVKKIKLDLKRAISMVPERASVFFKTGKGDYAENDQFIGVSVPNLRKIAKDFYDISVNDLTSLLQSKINEERLLALLILNEQYTKAPDADKERLYQFYLKNLKQVNNWNLVDASAHLIIGAHLWEKDRDSLAELANSESLWERRIAIVATWYFIRQNDLKWTFKLAKQLQGDTHDLMHKAVGWMLREAGKRDEVQLVKFLDRYADTMPRTMLRYAIEKFSAEDRKMYLMKKIKNKKL